MVIEIVQFESLNVNGNIEREITVNCILILIFLKWQIYYNLQ